MKVSGGEPSSPCADLVVQQHDLKTSSSTETDFSTDSLRHRRSPNKTKPPPPPPRNEDRCGFEEEELLQLRRLAVQDQVRKKVLFKMLFVTCVATFFLTSMVLVAQSRSQFNLTSRRLAQRAVRKIERKKTTHSTFTIVLKGSRIELLQQSLDHHARCNAVRGVRIDWQAQDDDDDDDGLPESIVGHRSGKVLEPGVEEKAKTDGILLLDEGIIFTCNELERGFSEWRVDPVRIVGLLPPLSQICEPFVSDSAAFVHRLLLDSRPKLSPSSNQCQHLALSAHISTLSSKKPVTVLTKPFVTDSDKRAVVECIVELKRVYGLKEYPTADIKM